MRPLNLKVKKKPIDHTQAAAIAKRKAARAKWVASRQLARKVCAEASRPDTDVRRQLVGLDLMPPDTPATRDFVLRLRFAAVPTIWTPGDLDGNDDEREEDPATWQERLEELVTKMLVTRGIRTMGIRVVARQEKGKKRGGAKTKKAA